MSDSPEDGLARREIVGSVVILVATAVVLVLSLRGTFSSAWYFPHVFGAVVGGFALVSLRTARAVLWKPRLALVAAIVALAVLAVVLHPRGVALKQESYENRGSAVVCGKPAPTIRYLSSIGLESDGPGTMSPSAG